MVPFRCCPYGTFFEAHQSTWLLKVSGEPLSRFGSSIVRKARPLHTETSSIVVCSTARGIFNGSISAIFNDLCQLMKILDLLWCSNLKTFHHKYSSLYDQFNINRILCILYNIYESKSFFLRAYIKAKVGQLLVHTFEAGKNTAPETIWDNSTNT